MSGLTEIEKANLRLECARIVMQSGSAQDQKDIETKAERIYSFVIGDTGAQVPPSMKKKS